MKLNIIFIQLLLLFLLTTAYSNISLAKGYGQKLCKNDPDNYSCYVVKKGETWEKLFPEPTKKELVKRINRRNERLHRNMTIAVPRSENLNLLEYAPFDQKIETDGFKIIVISLQKLAFGAYGPDGVLLHWGPISPGLNYCADVKRSCRTPVGKFAVYTKRGPTCRSSKYPVGRGGAPMPYCMFFYKGFALHGSPQVPGYNASHGCVRLFISDAKWLNQEFLADTTETPVIIKP